MPNNLVCDKENFDVELVELVRLFLPNFASCNIKIDISHDKQKEWLRIIINDKKYFYSDSSFDSELNTGMRKFLVRRYRIALYKALKQHFKRSLAWGALTGIRPTKMLVEQLDKNIDLKTATKNLKKMYFVSKKKADLVASIVKNQQPFLEKNPGLVNLYAHIPFCQTRCEYCSFVSMPLEKQKDLLQPYVEKLVLEISATKEKLAKENKKIYSIYVGGGTPSVLDVAQLEQVLQAINADGKTEFTFEAGRPETITPQKCEKLKKYNVSRLSVNPQILCDVTLNRIGRNHTVGDFYKGYNIALEYGFTKNVDLIIGLANYKTTISTVKKIIELKPENITLHSLCRKRGSIVNEKNISFLSDKIATKSMDVAGKLLKKAGYKPYYLYRQKNAVGNLENVGYSKEKHMCVNNISVMEEHLSVYACGAGAISKTICPKTNLITRHQNPKDVRLYLNQSLQ